MNFKTYSNAAGTARLAIAVSLGLGYLLAFQSASEVLSAGASGRDVLPERLGVDRRQHAHTLLDDPIQDG